MLKDLGIDYKFITIDRVTMESKKYICVREINSVVIIDMTKPTQRIRLPITADSAIMNPDNHILAFKVEAKIDETTSQDQLQMYDINTKTALKSCNIAEKVECWKWISPKLLGLVTLKAVYHWSTQDSTGLVKMFDITDKVATSKITVIRNYMLDPSEKWVVLMGYKQEDNKAYFPLFVRPNQGGDQWFSFTAHAATFTTFNVEGDDAPSTMLCSAVGRFRDEKTNYIELSVSDIFDSQQGAPNFAKKQEEFNTGELNSFISAVQIYQKYGLIIVITWRGLISIHDLETAEAICSCDIVDNKATDYENICTIEGPSTESFYSINKKGQVLLTIINDSTILSFLSDKLITTGKSRNLRKLCLKILKEKEEIVTNILEKSLEAEIIKKEELTNENEGLKRHNRELNNKSVKLKADLVESLSKMTEMEKHMLNEIEQLETQNVGQQIEKDNIITKLEKSLQGEITKSGEIEEQLAMVRTKMLNEIEWLQKENTKLQNERDKMVTHMAKSLEVQTKLQTEMEQHTSTLTEIKNSQVSQEETLIRIEGLTKQSTVLAETLQVEQNARRETEEQLRSKMTEIDKYQKSQEEMQSKIEDFRLLKETNNLEANFTEYSRVELEKVTNNFSDSLKIGEGGYGRVYKAFLGLKPVAIKMFNNERRNRVTEFNQEIEMMKAISHPNIVKLLGACKETQALVYELMPNGSLYDILRNEQQRSTLTSKIRIRIAFDICLGLIALHSAKPCIVHADLKPGNILLDLNYMAKLCDFGQSRHLKIIKEGSTPYHYTTKLKGTFLYWDPELFKAGKMTIQCDVYSFGIILLELVTGRDAGLLELVNGTEISLRDQVEEAFNKGEIFVDDSAGKWPFEEAKKMVKLGLKCSAPLRKNRPNLEKEVLPEIESMWRASLRF